MVQRYFITLIDDFSKKTFVNFLRNKKECFTKFHEFKTFAKAQIGKKLKLFKTNNMEENIVHASFKIFSKFMEFHIKLPQHTRCNKMVLSNM
jgi:hypothetical protein